MGYYTCYRIECHSKEKFDVEKINTELQNTGYSSLIVGEDSEQIKWYGHEGDMKTISSLFPKVLFVLHGAGDEREDFWKKEFQNGKLVSYKKAHLVFEEDSPSTQSN